MTQKINSLNKYLQKYLRTKDLGSLSKYTLDLLLEAGVVGCKSIDSSMDVNTQLLPNQAELFEDVGGTRD